MKAFLPLNNGISCLQSISYDCQEGFVLTALDKLNVGIFFVVINFKLIQVKAVKYFQII